MGDRKSLLFGFVLISVVFLLVQLLSSFQLWSSQIFGDQANDNNNLYKGDFKLAESITDLVQSCRESLQVDCVLVEEDLLISYVFHQTALLGGGGKVQSVPKKDRSLASSSSRSCGILCGKVSASFFVDGDSFSIATNKDVVDHFQNVLISKGFTAFKEERSDDRELSVEKRTTKQQLVYNLFLTRGETFLLVSFGYSRYGRWWTNECNYATVAPLIDDKWRTYLNNSMFCSHQRLVKVFKNKLAMIDDVEVSIPEDIPAFTESVRLGVYTPCDLKNARDFYSKFGFQSDPDSDSFRAKAAQLLSLASRVLSDLTVPFWLSSGTCLGWYRQCGFIPHSKDVDIGIWIKHYKPELVQAFLDRGLKLKHQFGKVEDSFELSFTLHNLKLDIFFFYEDDTLMWNGGTQARTGKKFKYIFPKFALCWTHLSGLTVRVPCPALPYVQANYGSSWNVLVKHWDWKSSPPNVRENGEWPAHERHQVIQVY